MENQNEIVLKINRDEIYFSCKGYSEEFINAISDVINQRRQSLIESSSVVKLEEPSSAGEIDDKKTETSEESINGSKKQGKKYHKTYKHGEKERIIEDIRNEFSFEEINKKYNISSATYYRIKKAIEAEIAADKSSKNSPAKISTMHVGRVKHRKVGFNPTSVSEEDKLKIAEDIKLRLSPSQILKKYHINIHAYSGIKKSLGISLKPKEKLNGELNSIKVDIDNIQEKICERPISLSANPEVREWQKDMIARGL